MKIFHFDPSFRFQTNEMNFNSPSRSSGTSKFAMGGTSQKFRSSAASKKPPEPLRRAIADCLSSSLPAALAHQGIPSALASESARTLRDYLADPMTMDISYSALVEHALAERDRSPTVVARCVVLLKRYLLRYLPGNETLQKINQFCALLISEYESVTKRISTPYSNLSSQQSAASMNTFSSLSSPISNHSPGTLLKSLQYVQSLVSRRLPRLSFQQQVFSGPSTASKQSFPTLASLLSKSFNSQLSPGNISNRESPELNEVSCPSVSNLTSLGINGGVESKYLPSDALTWQWADDWEQQQFSMVESGAILKPEGVSAQNYVEVGAAAFLMEDMAVTQKVETWKYSNVQDFSNFHQFFHPSKVTASTNFASSCTHLKAITACKRVKHDAHQLWESASESTFRPLARPLFHYRPYSEQQPLRLSPSEVQEVINAVCSDTSLPNVNHATTSCRLNNRTGISSMDAAFSVLIKLVIDMYVLDPQIAGPLTLSMLEEMVQSSTSLSKVRAFDLILNLGVHAHLLEPMLLEDHPAIGEGRSCHESNLRNEEHLQNPVNESLVQKEHKISTATNEFESWILGILYEILLFLVQIEEREEIVWASALSCLFYFVCDGGKILRGRLEGLDIRAIKVLLEISRDHSWSEVVHQKLICMLTNKFYTLHHDPIKTVTDAPIFIMEHVDLIGGIEFISLEYSQANSREEKRALFIVLFDYILHQINEACQVIGNLSYTISEVRCLSTMLILADAPETFYIALKHGEGHIGNILKKSISAVFPSDCNAERLTMLLESVTMKFHAIVRTFSQLDGELLYMMETTKSYKTRDSMLNEHSKVDTSIHARLSWATLWSLLHSERASYRHNGYIWLVELLVSEICNGKDASIWSNLKNFQQKISIIGNQELSTAPSDSLAIWIMCEILKSKYNYIRCGFLFVLEKFLMRCKFILDEFDQSAIAYGADKSFDKANALIDIMINALSLVAQKNETDRINILKMCCILFTQLCLKIHPETGASYRSFTAPSSTNCKTEKNNFRSEPSKTTHIDEYSSNFETASMASLIVRGSLAVPIQLIARVPAVLFYWPLFQLAGAASDDISLGVAVGSKRRGNLPGSTSDIRTSLLLLLIGKCMADPSVFLEVGGEQFFRELLDDTDSSVAYHSSAYLLKKMMNEEPEKYQHILQGLIFKAQQSNNEKLLENPYLQMRGILHLSNDLGSQS